MWASRAAWSATPGIIAEMFNQAFDTDQFNGITKPYLEIIPSWISKDFDPFFSWIPNIEIPDARADMIGAFTTGAGSNYWEISDPYVDETLIAAKQELDYETAYQMVRDVQEYVMERGQFGRSICYNYIFPYIGYNYNKIREAQVGLRRVGTSSPSACRPSSTGWILTTRRPLTARHRSRRRSDPNGRRGLGERSLRLPGASRFVPTV